MQLHYLRFDGDGFHEVTVPDEAFQRISEDVKALLDQPAEQGLYGAEPDPFTRLAAFNLLSDFFLEGLVSLIESLGGIDAVVAAFQKLYDTFIVPIDIPNIPEPLERRLDQFLKGLITRMLYRLWDAIQKA